MLYVFHRKRDYARRLANRIKAFKQFKSEMGQKVSTALEEKEQYVHAHPATSSLHPSSSSPSYLLLSFLSAHFPHSCSTLILVLFVSCRMRERTLDLNMQHYVCGPVREKSFQEMRSKTYQNRWAEKKKDLEKPEWYGTVELQCKTSTLGPEGVWYSESLVCCMTGFMVFYKWFVVIVGSIVVRSLLQ